MELIGIYISCFGVLLLIAGWACVLGVVKSYWKAVGFLTATWCILVTFFMALRYMFLNY